MAPLLSNLRIFILKFNPDKVTAEPYGTFSRAATTAEWIENDASTDRWQIGFPSHGHRLSWNVLPASILPTRLGSGYIVN